MSFVLISAPDDGRRIAYKIARVVYAETGATSLSLVNAMTSMIANLHRASGRTFDDIVADVDIFAVLDENHPHHNRMRVPANSRAFQMCVRVAMRMLCGGLNDTTRGAVNFHHDGVIPAWATTRGYIAEIDGVLFYR